MRPAVFTIGLVLGACHEAAPLPRAAAEGTDEVVEALAHGAAVDERDESGRTALHVAAEEGNEEIVRLLLARGARTDLRAPDGATPLHLSARRARRGCTEVLARATRDIDAVAGLRRRSALHDAVLATDDKTSLALLRAGSDPNKKDSFGATPLHLLARPDSPHTTQLGLLLVEAGADWRAQDGRGFTVLHAAAAVDDAALVRFVLSRADASVDQPSLGGETALDVAQRYGSDRAAELLLSAGAVAHAMPPLHEAAATRDLERTSALVKFGADLSRRFDGKTALDVARARGSIEVEAILTGVAAPEPRTP